MADPQDVVGLVAKAAKPYRLFQSSDTTWYVVVNGARYEIGKTPQTWQDAYRFWIAAKKHGIVG